MREGRKKPPGQRSDQVNEDKTMGWKKSLCRKLVYQVLKSVYTVYNKNGLRKMIKENEADRNLYNILNQVQISWGKMQYAYEFTIFLLQWSMSRPHISAVSKKSCIASAITVEQTVNPTLLRSVLSGMTENNRFWRLCFLLAFLIRIQIFLLASCQQRFFTDKVNQYFALVCCALAVCLGDLPST